MISKEGKLGGRVLAAVLTGLAFGLPDLGASLIARSQELLIEINLDGNSSREIGTTGLDSQDHASLTIDQWNGVAYVLGWVGGPGAAAVRTVSAVDIETGLRRLITAPRETRAIAAIDRGLLAIDDDSLFNIDSVSGEFEVLNSPGFSGPRLLATNGTEAYVIGFGSGGDTQDLHILNVSDGSMLRTISVRGSVESISSTASRLVAWDLSDLGGVYSINKTSGSMARYSTSLQDIFSFQIGAHPQNETVYVFGITAAGGPAISSIDMPTRRRTLFGTAGNQHFETLAVYEPPEPAQSIEPIQSIERLPDGRLRLQIPTALRRRIGVEYSTDLREGNWLDLGNFFIEGELASFTDPDFIRLGRDSGYYRAFLRPELP